MVQKWKQHAANLNWVHLLKHRNCLKFINSNELIWINDYSNRRNLATFRLRSNVFKIYFFQFLRKYFKYKLHHIIRGWASWKLGVSVQAFHVVRWFSLRGPLLFKIRSSQKAHKINKIIIRSYIQKVVLFWIWKPQLVVQIIERSTEKGTGFPIFPGTYNKKKSWDQFFQCQRFGHSQVSCYNKRVV